MQQYLYGLAVDSGNPLTVIVSASMSPWQAHSIKDAESLVYRRSEDDNDKWKAVSKGLPEPSGTMISILAQIQRVLENSMLLIIAEYFALLILVLPGKRLISHGPKSIFHNMLGH